MYKELTRILEKSWPQEIKAAIIARCSREASMSWKSKARMILISREGIGKNCHKSRDVIKRTGLGGQEIC